MPLRPELIRLPRPEGGEYVFDPLLERLYTLDGGEYPPELYEGPAAEQIRRTVVMARLVTAPPPDPPDGPIQLLATTFPDWVAPAWRELEAWRRLGEERRAGRTLLILRGFLDPAYARELAAAVAALEYHRVERQPVIASRAASADVTVELRAGLEGPLLPVVRAVLGRPIKAPVTFNTWRLEPGDHMRVHPDGRAYAVTWVLGLNEAWTADDGGAIAFGEPGDGFAVRERFLPFLGDLCLFAPTTTSWHAVETPRRDRYTVSGWWPWE